MGGPDSQPGIPPDEAWQRSLSAWAGSRRSSLQAGGSLRNSEAAEAALADDARARLLRHYAEVRLRNRPLSERIREKFRSLQDSDLEQQQRHRSLHSVEELLALRASTATDHWPAASARPDGDPVDLCSQQLGLRFGQDSRLKSTPSVRVTSVDLDGPADRCGIRPGDEILSVDGDSALLESPSTSPTDEVARRLVEAALADGVVHVRVRRRLPEPREPAVPPLPPLDTLPTQAAAAAPEHNSSIDNLERRIVRNEPSESASELPRIRLGLRRQSAPVVAGTTGSMALAAATRSATVKLSPMLLLAAAAEEHEDAKQCMPLSMDL